jgi:mRNA interferase MazF
MVIANSDCRQGDIYWTAFPMGTGSEPSGARPAIVVQGDFVNRSKLATTIVCPITSYLLREHAFGNVRLAKHEGGLPKPSIVMVAQVVTVDRSRLLKRLGNVSPSRVAEIIAGINLIFARL